MMRLRLQLLLQRLRLKTKLNFSLNAKNPVISLGFFYWMIYPFLITMNNNLILIQKKLVLRIIKTTLFFEMKKLSKKFKT